MITKDIYNGEITDSFESAIQSASQYIKPKVLINFLDSRHCENKVITTNDAHPSETQGSLGYFFNTSQAFNGIDRQSSTWGVAGALDHDGQIIRANGNWLTMPADKTDNYEYGWWSNSKSTASLHGTYNGYQFTTPPTLNIQFTSRKCNIIRVSTPEYYGQIDTYQIIVRSSDAGAPNPLYQEVSRIKDGEYFYDHYLPSTLGHQTVYRVELQILTTKNPLDHARLTAVDILYQVDLSDYVVSYSQSKTRDLHETSLPIAGTDSGSLSINLDNTNKDFNIFGTSSLYGKYMKKDLKVFVSSGWKVHDSDDLYIESTLRSNLANNAVTMTLMDNTNFPEGGANDYFVIEINPTSVNREYVLCSGKSNDYDINIVQRGYNNTVARNHSAGVTVRYETYQYPAFTEFYVDEWSSSTGDMVTSMTCTDWTKYLSERVLTSGFLLEKTTVPDACESLILKSNFPKAKIDSLNRFNLSAKKRNAILHFDFNETGVDRSGSQITVGNGLRARFFQVTDRSIPKVKDILADAIDKELTPLEKALDEKPFVSPDYSANSTSISDVDISSNQYTLNLADSDASISGFNFVNKNNETVSEYFNAVFDGFYTPQESGEQYISIEIANGGVRVYLEDTIIINAWRLHPVSAGQYETIESIAVYLTAGSQYKIRIETFHASGDFRIRLKTAYGVSASENVLPSQTKTIAVLDKIGSINSPFTVNGVDRNKNYNHGIYLAGPLIGISGGLPSDPDNKYCHLTSNAYIRVPYSVSWNLVSSSSNNYNGNSWSIELYARTPATYSSGGEYLSSWSNASPTSGFEFFSNSTLNGFSIVTSSGIEQATSNVALPTGGFNHIVVTCDSEVIKYYVNGQVKGQRTLTGTIASWNNNSITFGGRGATYTSGAEVAPSTIREVYFDEFVMYDSCLSAKNVADRYTESQMKELTIYPFLYGGENSIREIIDEISLADLGRFYIDEENFAKYEHYYRFWEPTIDQHANVQLNISDSSYILNADYNVQLQTNRVVVKISGISNNLSGTQGLWRAEDPTTLAVVNLQANIVSNATSMTVSTTDDPPFAKSGYLIIDDEIIKYNKKSGNQFLELERGFFNTTAASHLANTAVREVRYWDVKYDKAPALQVKNPFITGIIFEEPDQISILRFTPGSYGAELIISASNNVAKGEIVFAEGTNPLTEKVAYTAIAGIPVIITEEKSQIKSQTAEIEESISMYGLKEVVIENKFITDTLHAQKIADFIIEKTSDPVPVLNVQTVPTPLLKVGDRIRISNLTAFDIINGDYWVVSKNYDYGDSPGQSLILRKVV